MPSPTAHTEIRVRFAETDQMGVVHHSVYPVWFEAGRVEWMRQRSLSYRELEDSGISLAVARLEVSYRTPARFDDVITVESTLVSARSRQVVFEYRLTTQPGTVLVATGRSEHVPTDRSGRAVRLPGAWLDPLVR
ncbi:MAG TPA: thioesterase family protein [Trueperaceae bacterium]|nr:thioesterase family protein [Trueperaceae bacterium]